MNQVSIDWESITTAEDFYDYALYQLGAPEWHEKNLDALNDSLVTGGINSNDVPYHFIFINEACPEMAEFREAVIEISSLSVMGHGGMLEVRLA